MDKQTQNVKIYEHLKAGNSITPIEALEMFGCLRLSGRIFDIKKIYDADIKSEIVNENGKRYARYRI